ncbi:YeeE/YedE thiosulfate transporter family protein [Devosia sp. ZB163]|uniref:DUF6691 family protein n=1 Tax=Devosia sp. ZB163 TaxID=3025938 RepID=UPI0023618F78|nr:DUF6691 family protein [Devosia sp. ZB163]MDC9823690.1 YeeE/YedE thiosulfate transporter family protein [Devosia sp. ZB163]
MRAVISAGLAGLVFGAGIAISGMGNPAKVLNFFDVFGTWDPSLLLVMASALTVTMIGYRLVLRRPAPRFDSGFHLPTRRDLDPALIGGSALFGIGWGIAGFCPGGAIPMLGLGEPAALLFVLAMATAMLVTHQLRNAARRAPPQPQTN